MQFTPQNNYVGLNNGILLTSYEYKDSQLHFDEAHIKQIKNMSGFEKEVTNLGIVESLFNQIGLNYRGSKTLWNLDANGKNNTVVVNNNDGIYTFDVVLGDHTTNKAKILSFEAANPEKPGVDESPIWIRLDKRLVGANAIIYLSKYSGIEFITKGHPRGSVTEGFLYETQLVVNNNHNTYVPAMYLTESAYVCAGPGITSERNEDYDDRQVGSAVRRFFNSMGNAVNQKYFTVTRNAAMSKMPSNNLLSHSLDQHTAMYKVDLMSSNSYAAQGMGMTGKNEVGAFLSKGYKSQADMKKSIVHTLIVPQLEMYYMGLIAAENNHYAVWGNGGTVAVGKDQQKVQLPIGLFRQMMKQANKQSYNLDKFNFDNFIGFIRNGFSKIASPGNKVQVKVKCGMGSLQLAQEAITKKFGTIPGILNLNEFINNKGGDNLELGYSIGFRRFLMPLGDIEIIFEYAEELDSPTGDPNQIDNPIIKNGLRLSSYSFIIDDITGLGTNIVELQNGTLENDYHIMWADGKMPYLGDPSRHSISSISIPGYEVYIEKAFKAYHVMDPGKVWMYLPLNPKTKAMFGANAYDRW